MNEHIYCIGKQFQEQLNIPTYVIVVYSGRFEHLVHAGWFVNIRDTFYYWSKFLSGVTQNYLVIIQSECSVHLYQHHYYLMFQKHESAAIQGHDDPSALPDSVSKETDDAVTAHSG